jgi:hypothetical protein
MTILLTCLMLVLQGEKEINLARCQNARVSVSSVNGDQEMASPYCGVRNLFDGGSHMVNGINYSYWLTQPGNDRPWARVRFIAPVRVSRVVIDLVEQYDPEWVLVEVRTGETTTEHGPFKATVPRTVVEFPRTMEDVREIRIVFIRVAGNGLTRVDEIAVMGPGARESLTEPKIDVDEGELRRVAARTVREYLQSRYTQGVLEKTDEGWSYVIRVDGKEVLKIVLDSDAVPLRIIHTEAGHEQKPGEVEAKR